MTATEKYLPLGSVVLLRDGHKKLMIYGRRQFDVNSKKEYDYLCCPYPEGFLSPEYAYLVKHEDIAEIFYLGCKDQEEKEYLPKLKSMKY